MNKIAPDNEYCLDEVVDVKGLKDRSVKVLGLRISRDALIDLYLQTEDREELATLGRLIVESRLAEKRVLDGVQ